MKPTKTAVVGVGYWGSKLLRNVVNLVGAENVVAVDSHVDRLAAVLSEYPPIDSRLQLEHALDDGSVQAVIIATPVESHAELARLALERDCHVLVEKPFTTSVEESLSLVRLADAMERVLMVGHTFLFSPRVQWIAAHLAKQPDLGLHYITSSRLNLGVHRPDANVIWDLAPHDLSIIFHLVGEFPSTIAATVRSIVRQDHPDVAFVEMQFPSGVIASINVSWLSPRKVRSLMLVGDMGMISYDDTDPDEPVKVFDRGVAVEESPDFGVHQLTYRYGDTVAPHIAVLEPLTEELVHFYTCISSGDRPRSDGIFGANVVAALAAADASWQEGGIPVELERLRPPALRRASRRDWDDEPQGLTVAGSSRNN